MLAGVTPFGLHRLPVIYRAFGTDYANSYIIAKIKVKCKFFTLQMTCLNYFV